VVSWAGGGLMHWGRGGLLEVGVAIGAGIRWERGGEEKGG